MQYRALTSTGDYTLGHGSQEMLTGVKAVAQAIQTRLWLYQGSFWRNPSDGTPWLQSILGQGRGSVDNLQLVDTLIENRIQGTQDVSGIVSYQRIWNNVTRSYGAQSVVNTSFSEATITVTV